ncbi:MAG: carbohydrate kinase family protein [Candidatus Doudnabacteria bacterium]|nr:carbohydrate kinase family protein [Candidatus Doudnabacteria bacterium]
MPKYDIVSIGDTTLDAFIELHEASVHCSVNHVDCQLCMSFANKIPFENLTILPACGNSANNAIGSSRLGMKDAFIGSIGDDQQGQQIIKELENEKVDSQFVNINPGVPTNFHFVLVYRGERTILIKHQKYVYKLPAELDTKWIYFSSMAEGTDKFHTEVDKFLQKHKNVKVGFNPGTFQMRMGTKKLAGIYKRTEVLFLNREEAQAVTGEKSRDIHKLAHGMHKLGAKIAVITDGRDGSYASDGGNIWFVDHFPAPRVEATGAGDAYSTAFIGALFHGKTIPEAMVWGTVNGGNVALHVGPHVGLQTVKQIETWMKAHPKFKAKEFK